MFKSHLVFGNTKSGLIFQWSEEISSEVIFYDSEIITKRSLCAVTGTCRIIYDQIRIKPYKEREDRET